MPIVKIERVVSVSSEDKNHEASNLLQRDFSNKKWKCKTPGEKNISVILQLEKACKIVAVDVGNENSAFIEILVGHSAEPDTLKPLLVTSSLMTLQEGKNGDNTNGVKFFKSESFCESVKDEKWDRVKLVCTQPYNKYSQFGLSFVTFHSDEHDLPACNFGKFQLKVEKQKQPLLQAGGLFAQRKELNELTGAAAVHAANRNIGDIKLPSSIKNKFVVVNPVTTDDVDEQTEEVNSTTKQKKQKTPKVKKNSEKRNASPASSTPTSSVKKRKTNDQSPNSKVVAPKPVKKCAEKSFNKFFENVVFVISGFQNPLRSDIRSKGLAMGAKYKADWDASCTHLICAFANTPKFNQVRNKGKIVKKEWFEDSYAKRIALPWRRYALDPNDLHQKESDEEIYEKVDKPKRIDNRRRIYDTDSEDTEDELEQVRQAQKKKNRTSVEKIQPQPTSPENVAGPSRAPVPPARNDDVYNADTEEEEFGMIENSSDSEENLPHLHRFFQCMTFLLLDDVEEKEREKLQRYIVAHDGMALSREDHLPGRCFGQ
ncbi:DNA repair protein XRCC1-like isoform X2 [Cimex lectularius]|uniref:BRCT domain-containing protein n=1 Tax=Cimex lectularius TaxID=79782 RepID=A0A8I6S5J5_CIMLE|nr:DNA repair protein XRCC1-like isoform X2 [Cimex lectularius]